MLKNSMFIIGILFLICCHSRINKMPDELIGTWNNYTAVYGEHFNITIAEDYIEYWVGFIPDADVFRVHLKDMLLYKQKGTLYEFSFYDNCLKKNQKWIFTRDPKYLYSHDEDVILFAIVDLDDEILKDPEESLLVFHRATN